MRLPDGTPVQLSAHAAGINLIVGDDDELLSFDDEDAVLRTRRAEAALRALLARAGEHLDGGP